MNKQELQQLVEQISLRYFGRPFRHRVTINHRLTTTGGRYHLKDHHIDINAHFLAPQYRSALVGIIKHELCHYHLHLAHLGYRHRDRAFKQLLRQVGGSRYTPDIGLRRKRRANYLYQCQDCGLKYLRVRRLNTQRYLCGRCGGPLKLISRRR